MLGMAATAALCGVLIKSIGKISTEKGFAFGSKKIINHLKEKNKGKETKFSRFLNKMVGVSNEDIAAMINERSDEIREAMLSGGGNLDETGQGLLEMTKQLQEMMENYQNMESRDQEFVQSLKDAINPETLASEIVEAMKERREDMLTVDDIKEEIGGLFDTLGWEEKFERLQSRLDRVDKDLKRILNKAGIMADDVSGIKKKLDGLGNIKGGDIDNTTEIADSVLHRSNVVTAGGDVEIINADKVTKIDVEGLSRSDWKDVITDAIKGSGIGEDLEHLASITGDPCLSNSEIGKKFVEVNSYFGDFELDPEVLIRMANTFYTTGEYKKAYDCYMRVSEERRGCVEKNMKKVFSDRNVRERILSETSKVKDKLFLSLEELYESNDLRNYRSVKKIHDDLTLFVGDVRASVEGMPTERDRSGTTAGFGDEKFGKLAVLYEELFKRINAICWKAEQIRHCIISGSPGMIKEVTMPIKNDLVSLRNRYKDRMSIIKEVA